MILSHNTVLFFIIQLLNVHQFFKITKEWYNWTGNINTVNMTCEANASWKVCAWEHVDSGKNCNIEWKNAKVIIPYEIKLIRNISLYIKLQTILGLLYRKRNKIFLHNEHCLRKKYYSFLPTFQSFSSKSKVSLEIWCFRRFQNCPYF